MTKLLGISGSLRKASSNTGLLRAIAAMAPAHVEVEIATLNGIPLFNEDDEAATGKPEAVKALDAKIRAADGIVFACPEYNFSIPGVLKNATDWLSRGGSPFRWKRVGLVGAGSPAQGAEGGALPAEPAGAAGHHLAAARDLREPQRREVRRGGKPHRRRDPALSGQVARLLPRMGGEAALAAWGPRPPYASCCARRPMKPSHFRSSEMSMYSSGLCAWSMEPGPQITAGMPICWNRPASVQ